MDWIRSEESIMTPSFKKRGLTLVRGQGVFLFDNQGRQYLDLMSNMGVNILGHSHPVLVAAIKKQVATLINLHGSFTSQMRVLAAQKLLSFLPPELKRVFFTNSGAEAVEAALKYAYLATKRNVFISAKLGYHGKTLGALMVMGNPKYVSDFQNCIPLSRKVGFGDLADLKSNLDSQVAAVILEPIQGEAGIKVPAASYLPEVKKLCRRNDSLLILDEIQSGCGRTGKFLASEHFKAKPDIVCLSKGVAGGVPMGVTVVTEEIAQKIPAGIHTNTFGGNPLACAASIAVLDFMRKKNLIVQVSQVGEYLKRKLEGIKSQKIREIRGLGLMIGIELKENATKTIINLQKQGILVAPSGANTMRLLPPLILEKEQIDYAIPIFENVLN